MSAQNPRFPLFDSLRAIAAGSVLLFHVAFVLGGFTKDGYGKYLIQLNIGVPIFFLISGFLLYRPFVAARFRGDSPPATGPYAIRRFFRIVPAYWVALPLVAAWTGLAAVGHNPLPYFGFAQVYDRSTLINGYGIAWTLCVEVSFYALLPLWALAMRRAGRGSRRRLVLTEALPLVLMFLAAVAWNATQTEASHGFITFTPAIATIPAFLDHFALGMGLAVASVALMGRERQPGVVRAIEGRPWLPWLFALAVFVGLCNIERHFGAVPSEVVRHHLRGLVAFGVLLPAVFGADRGGAVRRFLADRRMQWIGLISYSLYLWHPAITQKMGLWNWDDKLGWLGYSAAAIVICIAVAAVSFYVVERPGLRIGRALAGRFGYQEPEQPPGGAVDRPGAPSVELAGAGERRPS
jgi:peptidoglycan/LPS O-acetylase OafA/YrhL